MDYRQSFRYLESFINYEHKNSYDCDHAFALDRVRALCSALQITDLRLPAIHIAGTKGKGSVACFCAWVLAASGFKTGLYTSPHFFDFRERIRILYRCGRKTAQTMIPEDSLVQIVSEIKTAVAGPEKKKINGLTFFEIYTALALRYFVLEQNDFMVLETGLGGRLDATNIVTPLVSVITYIGYDHTDKLGSSLASIAGEKAGIIKDNCPLVCAEQRKSAAAVIKNRAAKKKAPLYLFGRDFWPENVRFSAEESRFDFVFSGRKIKDLRICLRGRHQVDNACLALAAVSILKNRDKLKQRPAWKKGLSLCRIEGRAEVISRNPLIMVDVAHNPASFSVLNETVKTYYPDKKIILVFASSSDKDVKNMVNKIRYNKIVLTQFKSPRSFSLSALFERLKLKQALLSGSVSEALEKAEAVYDKDSLILVAGSFFLAAEAKKEVRRQKSEVRT